MEPNWSELRRAAAAVSEFRYVEAGAIAKGAMPEGLDVDRLRGVLAATGAHRNDPRMIEMAVAVDVHRITLSEGAPLPVLADIGKNLLELGRRTGNGAHLARAEADLRTVVADAPDRETRDRSRHDLADLLQTVARWSGHAEPAREAERLFADLAATADRASRPDAWAWAVNSHATSLETLSRLTGDEERAWDAVDAYGRVLGFWTREAYPEEWATASNNMGAAFRDMASRYGREDLLDRAVAAFEDALLVWKRGTHPSDWAMARTNLGMAASGRASRDKDAAGLVLACGIIGEARGVRTLDASPNEWRGMTTVLARRSAEAWRLRRDEVSGKAAARFYAEVLLTMHDGDGIETAATLEGELEALRREMSPDQVGKPVGIRVGGRRPPGIAWAWASAGVLALAAPLMALVAVLGNDWMPLPVLAMLGGASLLWVYVSKHLAARMSAGVVMTREGFTVGRSKACVPWKDCREVGYLLAGAESAMQIVAAPEQPRTGGTASVYVIELGNETDPKSVSAIANYLMHAGRMQGIVA